MLFLEGSVLELRQAADASGEGVAQMRRKGNIVADGDEKTGKDFLGKLWNGP